MKAPFHSHKRCSHTAKAADEHICAWVSSEILQAARNLNDTKGCATLRLILNRSMRSILLNVATVNPDSNLPVFHPSPCLKHLSCRPFLHSFLSQPQRSCPVQLAPFLPTHRGKTRGVLVLVLGYARQAQNVVQVEEVLLEVISRSALWSAFPTQ